MAKSDFGQVKLHLFQKMSFFKVGTFILATRIESVVLRKHIYEVKIMVFTVFKFFISTFWDLGSNKIRE